MHLTFSTQHIHGGLGESIQNYAKERLTEVLNKYVHLERPKQEQILAVDVKFSKEKDSFKCSIIIFKLENSGDLKAEGNSKDIDDAFEKAIHELEKPLKIYQDKLKEHRELKTVKAEEKAMDLSTHSLDQSDKEDLDYKIKKAAHDIADKEDLDDNIKSNDINK